jgi:dTMP kinase
MIRGHFIVLEGIDGSGTTTQAGALAKKFALEKLPALVTAEPSSGPIGSLIRQILGGRLVVQSIQGLVPPSWKSMALLFAADRQDHIESEISPNLEDGVTVICDRYVYSSVIYQSLSSENPDAEGWIRELNRHAFKPDLVLYLKVNPDEALRRRKGRDRKTEIFDDPIFQQRIAAAYDELPRMFPDTRIVTIDSNLMPEIITELCWAEIERVRKQGAPGEACPL